MALEEGEEEEEEGYEGAEGDEEGASGLGDGRIFWEELLRDYTQHVRRENPAVQLGGRKRREPAHLAARRGDGGDGEGAGSLCQSTVHGVTSEV